MSEIQMNKRLNIAVNQKIDGFFIFVKILF